MCTRVLWLLSQITTTLVALNYTNLLLYSSSGQKSKVGFSGLKVQMLAGLCSSEGIKGGIIFLAFPASRSHLFSSAQPAMASQVFL